MRYFCVKNKVLYYNERALPKDTSFFEIVQNIEKGYISYRRYDHPLFRNQVCVKGSADFSNLIGVCLVREKENV